MTRKRRFHIGLAAAFVASFVLWSVSGAALYLHVSYQKNMQYLDGLADQLMVRAEKAVDFVVNAGATIFLSGAPVCSPASKQLLRQLALDNPTAANIHLIYGNTRCFSFEEFAGSLPSDEARGNWAAARNGDFRLGGLDLQTGRLVGVSWGFGTELELVVAFDPDALLFDVLQGELRSSGQVSLSVDNEQIAAFVGERAAQTATADWAVFSKTGARYPLAVDILVDPVVVKAWRAEVPTFVAVVWGVFGLGVAGVVTFALARGRDPALFVLRDAMENCEIVPFFQPIVDLKSGRVSGCEVLARWIKPDGAVVGPGAFIPLIEAHGLNNALFRSLVAQTAKAFQGGLARDPDFYFGFNVMPEQLAADGFVAELQDLIRQHQFLPRQICIEVTERQLVCSPERVAATVAALTEAGFRVAIDDAGTGHNGLSTLQALPVDTLKIDKFFVDQIDADPRSRVMAEMFVAVARQYGMRTIAEGVETAAQVNALAALGVDAVQGYYVSQPVASEAFIFAMETAWAHLDLSPDSASAKAHVA